MPFKQCLPTIHAKTMLKYRLEIHKKNVFFQPPLSHLKLTLRGT